MRLIYEGTRSCLYLGDCLEWLEAQPPASIHAVLTDPPYGLIEYSDKELTKRANGRGGVWRIPPSIGGSVRSPLPRFTVLSQAETDALYGFFKRWAELLLPVLTPGAHVVVASNPLLSHVLSKALDDAGLERRGEIIRLVRTLRGGDRPKGAETEFPEVSAMPRSSWEPWVLFRRPLDGTLAANLRTWGTGGLRRPAVDEPFVDVIASAPARRKERALAPHPSIKPQAFLRQVARALLPIGEGTVLDPFAGSGSTLAACDAIGYRSTGVEISEEYATLAADAIPKLESLADEGEIAIRGPEAPSPEPPALF